MLARVSCRKCSVSFGPATSCSQLASLSHLLRSSRSFNILRNKLLQREHQLPKHQQSQHATIHRKMCTGATNVKIGKMSFEQAYQAQKDILTKCSSERFIKALQAIKTQDSSILWKWNLLVSFLVPVQIEVMSALKNEEGEALFPPNQLGLLAFNSQTLSHRRNINSMVSNAWNKLWGFLLQVAFDITPQDLAAAPPFSVDQARQLAISVSQAMQTDSVAKQLDKELEGIPNDETAQSKEARTRALLRVLHPLQVSLIRGFGFNGDKGFILAQKAINEHSDDRVIMSAIADGTFTLFRRAGLA